MIVSLAVLTVSGCTGSMSVSPTPTPAPSSSPVPTATPTATPSGTPTPVTVATATPVPSPVPTPVATLVTSPDVVTLTGWPYYEFNWTLHDESEFPILLTIDGEVPETFDVRYADLKSYPQHHVEMTLGGITHAGTGPYVADLLDSTGLADHDGLSLYAFGNMSDGSMFTLIIMSLENIYDGTFALVLIDNGDNTAGLAIQGSGFEYWFARVNRITITAHV